MNTQRLNGVLIGTLLGDAWISSDDISVRFEHSIKQAEYVDYKSKMIGNLSGRNVKIYDRESRSTVIDGVRIIDSNPSKTGVYGHKSIVEPLRSLMYNADRVKYISNSLMEQLTPEGLALWYFDDGSFNYSQISGALSTYCFTLCDHHIMQEWLDKKFGIHANISTKKDNKRGTKNYYLYFNRKNILALFDIIECALNDIPLSMRYKIPISWKKVEYASDYKWTRLQNYWSETKKKDAIRNNLKSYHKEHKDTNPDPDNYFDILGYKIYKHSYSISKAIRSVYGSVEQALLQANLPTKLC